MRKSELRASHRQALALGPSAVWYLPGALFEGDELIGCQTLEGFNRTVRPVNFDVDRTCISQSKMQPGIVARIETRLAQDVLSLRFSFKMRQNTGSNRTSVGFHTFKFDLEPALLAAQIVAQKRGRFVQIDDKDVQIAFVVEVAEGTSAARMRVRYRRAGEVEEFFEH